MSEEDEARPADLPPFLAEYGRQIRIFSESGGFPMWATGGSISPSAARNTFGLDEELIADLERWGADEDAVYLPEGWEERRRAEGEELARRVQDQVGDEYDVVFHWP